MKNMPMEQFGDYLQHQEKSPEDVIKEKLIEVVKMLDLSPEKSDEIYQALITPEKLKEIESRLAELEEAGESQITYLQGEIKKIIEGTKFE